MTDHQETRSPLQILLSRLDGERRYEPDEDVDKAILAAAAVLAPMWAAVLAAVGPVAR